MEIGSAVLMIHIWSSASYLANSQILHMYEHWLHDPNYNLALCIMRLKQWLLWVHLSKCVQQGYLFAKRRML